MVWDPQLGRIDAIRALASTTGGIYRADIRMSTAVNQTAEALVGIAPEPAVRSLAAHAIASGERQ